MNSPILSIVILNYNSGKYLSSCLNSLKSSKTNYLFEVIVVDNKSTDGSTDLSTSNFNLNLKIIKNKKNIGFSAGNNIGIKKTNPNSKYLLFLNPDTVVKKDTIQKTIDFFQKNPKVDAATCKIILAKTGKIQPECHRGFPTPLRAFTYFLKIYKLFPNSKLFGGYFLSHLDLTKTHKIEACVGAFIIIKRRVGDKIGWWNEKYFMYGEDLDLCYKLYQNNFNLFYYPHCTIVHFQGISSGIKSQSSNLTKASRLTKARSAKASTSAMRIFYQQNLFDKYTPLTRFLVNTAINFLEFIRVFKAKYL
jgi:GT2 family glycosyltransferase